MKLCPRIGLCALGFVAVSACSHPATSSSGTVPSADVRDVVIPARITNGGMTTLKVTGGRPHGTVEIPVDETGRPDTYGIRFIGTFGESTKRDIADWVSQASFSAAKRNGIPEKGVVKMTFK